MELFDLIQTLVGAHGPSGDEGEIRETISRLAAPLAALHLPRPSTPVKR